jgi:triphosphoribosyl-dephospho-CoA synthetase
MAVSRALRRLLRIRNLEEEQSHLALESALGEFNRLENALTSAVERELRGRRLVEASALSGQLSDRLAGIEETRSAGRHALMLEPRIKAGEDEVMARRQEFLLKRVARRQAETLIQKTEARDAVEVDRHMQQTLDDWYNSRLHGERAEAEPPAPKGQ